MPVNQLTADPEIVPPELAPVPLARLLREVASAPPGVPPGLWQAALAGPLSEFLNRPGKRFRGRLVALTWALAGRRDEPPPALGLLVELLHAGSLVVDDIEDGSVQRRGRAALHRIVGVPVALNLGNWLYFWPFTLLRGLGLPGPVELDLHRRMAEAVRRCHEGQALDLTARIGDLHPSEVRTLAGLIGAWKTGSLMALAAELGAAAAGADPALVAEVGAFGERVGVGLQMQNDLSELTGAAGPIKHPEDLIHGRVTWPWAWASERLPAARFDALQVRGASLCDGAGDAAALARDLLDALGPDPRRPIGDWLASAYNDLRAEVGPAPALAEIRAELARLETRYA
jgi:geranylgeranyl pyrophosphate synthase